MYALTTKQTMLNAASNVLGWVSLHSAFPGANGANEIPGVSRAASSWIAAADGHKRKAGQVAMTVPAGVTVAWIGLWSDQTAGTFEGRAPVGGHPLEFYVVIGTQRIFLPGGHHWADGDTVVFFGGTPPAPLVEGQDYYLRDVLSDQVRVTSTPGGTAIPLTSGGADSCLIAKRTVLSVTSSISIITVPGFYLRFSRNFDPVWTGTIPELNPGDTFNLNTICSDANADAIVFNVDEAGAPLPTGVGLTPTTGIISVALNAPPADLSGVFIFADDGVGD